MPWPRSFPASLPRTTAPTHRTRATKTAPNAILEGASRLLAARPALPGRRLLTWENRVLAARVQPGQYLYLIDPLPRGVLLPALSVAGFDRSRGTIDLYVADDPPEPGLSVLLELREGESANFAGPLGRGFQIDARSRFLLVVTDSTGLGRVRGLIDEAIASGRQVTMLYGAASTADVFPSTLLRDETEYIVATADGSLGHRGPVIDLVTEYEAWADQCFTAGSDDLVSRMGTLARGRDGRMGVARLGRRRARRAPTRSAGARRRAWLQVGVAHPAGCLLGVCLGCVVTGATGPVRACREGPTFAADELRWETGT